MNRILLLDCTLRDGGYVNNWHFGKSNIRKVVQKIVQSGTEVIECGYLSASAPDDPDTARFAAIDAVKRTYAPQKNAGQQYAVMINYGEYPAEALPVADAESPIIRLAFHKKDIDNAFAYFSRLEALGYTYYIQPMGVLNYTDEEFIRLIQRANATNAAAFYIVDSFGVIEHKDFRRLMFVADNNLRSDILLGYHSHNNLQQAYSNAKYMTEQNIEHPMIIDASVFGMGRGAGNLNIELFARYLNQSEGKSYDIEPFLEVFDECLKPIFVNNFWGYSLPFYLSSIHNCHPNYASYFSEKNTLSVKSMHELLSMLSDEDKISFSIEKASMYYHRYQENFVDDSETLAELRRVVSSRDVLILAPGQSLKADRTDIESFIAKEKPVIFGVNTACDFYHYDYLFIANEKRLTDNVPENVDRRIVTSNLKAADDGILMVNYASYLVKDSGIPDDPTFMLINLLKAVGVKQVGLAGFDGFTSDPERNYFGKNMSLGTKLDTKIKKNELKKQEIRRINELVRISFITRSLYEA